MEIELKLALAAADAQAFAQHPLLTHFAQARPSVRTLHNTYFDTAELLLRRHDCGLRVRRSGAASLQTLKGGGGVAGGLHAREEWETPVDGAEPELTRLRRVIDGKRWRKLLGQPGLQGALLPIFTTDFERTAWQLRSANGDEVELALDIGRIVYAEREAPICEIELELKRGDQSCLFELALALQRDFALTVANASKAERGYALFQPRAARVATPAPQMLQHGQRAAAAWLAIAADCVQRLQANERAVAQGVDPDAVHKMHVATRRLRAAGALFETEPDAALTAELAWLAHTLGEARDWHLFAEVTLMEVLCGQPDQPELAQLRLAAAEIARQRRLTAADAIASPRYTRLLLGLGHWMHLQAGASRLDQAVEKFAARRLATLEARLARRGGRMEGSGAEGWHRVRLAAKQLRYGLEFFASVAPHPARVRRLKALQRELGGLNDAVTGARLLAGADSLHASFGGGAGYAAGYLAARIAQAQAQAQRCWKAYAKER